MATTEGADLCFPQINTSCRKIMQPHLEATLMYILLSCITLVTVILNLLVIISISHFRQLHTTTNLILLSLAVSDFLMGVLQMPVEILVSRGCWLLGDFMCGVYYFMSSLLASVSVGNMVLISVDRYVAICDPMLYSTKVTLKRVQLCVCLCWIFSAFHRSWLLWDLLKEPDRYNSCYGECVVVINYVDGVFDFVVTFFGPIVVIIVLYVRVFVVAVSQARAMNSRNAAVTLQRSKTVTAKKSEMKAARTLGVVVVVFLLCLCPFYIHSASLAADNVVMLDQASTVIEVWIWNLTSCLNPVIYVFFYPWFRKSLKHVLTLQTLKPHSRDANML